MALPGNISHVWVRGRFITHTGAGVTGKVTFAPNAKVMIDHDALVIIEQSGTSVALDSTGAFAVELLSTDDPVLTPAHWNYRVTEPTGRGYYLYTPMATPVINDPDDPLDGLKVIELTDVVPTPGASGGVGQLLRGVGITSMSNDGAGNILVAYSDGTHQTIPGPFGGGVSGQVTWSVTAATALSGHRVVTRLADGMVGYADNTTTAHISAPLWMTLGAASMGGQVSVLEFGVCDEPSWSWTPGPLYLGANGVLTQTPPTAPAFLAQVGYATAPTSVFIERRPSLVLA